MRFGLSGCSGALDSTNLNLLRGAELAEELGFSGIWMNEEHFRSGERQCLTSQILGAAIAARTTKLTIGFSVLLLPLHHPLRLAEEIASLDVISNGRVNFGISRGHGGNYFEAYKIDPNLRTDSFRESLDFILNCWTKDEVDINGKGYNVQPKPVQKPHPPVYIGTHTEETARWIAKSGYRLIQASTQSKWHIEKMLRAYEDAGGKVSDVPVGRMVYVGEDDSTARMEAWPAVLKVTEFYGSIKSFKGKILTEKDLEPDRFIEEMAIVGSPSTCVEKIRELREKMGIEYLNSGISFFGQLPPDKVQRSMVLLSKQVISQLN